MTVLYVKPNTTLHEDEAISHKKCTIKMETVAPIVPPLHRHFGIESAPDPCLEKHITTFSIFLLRCFYFLLET